jgi:hypothetical protein
VSPLDSLVQQSLTVYNINTSKQTSAWFDARSTNQLFEMSFFNGNVLTLSCFIRNDRVADLTRSNMFLWQGSSWQKTVKKSAVGCDI